MRLHLPKNLLVAVLGALSFSTAWATDFNTTVSEATIDVTADNCINVGDDVTLTVSGSNGIQVSSDTVVKQGSGTLKLTGTNNLADKTIRVQEGALELATGGATPVLKKTTIDINGGASLITSSHDSLSWGDNSTSKIILQGSSESDKALWINRDTGSLTLPTAVELLGYAQIQGSKINSYGGGFSVSGLGNGISSDIDVRNNLSISVAEGGELTLTGKLNKFSDGNGTLTKDGAGTLIVHNTAGAYDRTVSINAGTVRVEAGSLTKGAVTVGEQGSMVISGTYVVGASPIQNQGSLSFEEGAVLDITNLSVSTCEFDTSTAGFVVDGTTNASLYTGNGSVSGISNVSLMAGGHVVTGTLSQDGALRVDSYSYNIVGSSTSVEDVRETIGAASYRVNQIYVGEGAMLTGVHGSKAAADNSPLTGVPDYDVVGTGTVVLDGMMQYHSASESVDHFLENFEGTIQIGDGARLRLGNTSNLLANIAGVKIEHGGALSSWSNHFAKAIELHGGELATNSNNTEYRGKVTVTENSTIGNSATGNYTVTLSGGLELADGKTLTARNASIALSGSGAVSMGVGSQIVMTTGRQLTHDGFRYENSTILANEASALSMWQSAISVQGGSLVQTANADAGYKEIRAALDGVQLVNNANMHTKLNNAANALSGMSVAGQVTLMSNASVSGATTVSAGGTITVESGATLTANGSVENNGSISGNVVVEDGGSLRSSGSLSGNVALNNGGTLYLSSYGTQGNARDASSPLTVEGTLTLGSGSAISLESGLSGELSALGDGTYSLLTATDGLNIDSSTLDGLKTTVEDLYTGKTVTWNLPSAENSNTLSYTLTTTLDATFSSYDAETKQATLLLSGDLPTGSDILSLTLSFVDLKQLQQAVGNNEEWISFALTTEGGVAVTIPENVHSLLVNGYAGEGVTFNGNVAGAGLEHQGYLMSELVPEPATGTLALLALSALCARRRRSEA